MNDEPLFSEHWFRVRHLKPSLAVDVTVRRQRFRGVTAWVLHRSSTASYHRLESQAWNTLARADGTRTVDELWQLALTEGGDEAPSQATMIEWFAQLHEAELLIVNNRLNAERLFDRGQEAANRDVYQRYLNPLYVRFALFDPDTLLNRLRPLADRLFNRFTAIGLLLLCVVALFLIAPHGATLLQEVGQVSQFSSSDALRLLLLYPALKLLHELAHALAIKRRGGEVHEIGIALMVLLPIPYVDASAATLFTDKRDRILVSAAGVLAELCMAAVAAIIWVNSSGLLHELALYTIVIGSVSTLLFNGNPLLKFDGYYVLADAIEIPNLAGRARRQILENARVWLLGMPPQEAPLTDRAEARWLIGYGLLSSIYRIGLMCSIAWMLSGEYFFFGAALALWVVGTSLLMPLYRCARFLVQSRAEIRIGRVFSCSLLGLALPAALLWLPLPQRTVSTGIVWLPDNAIVRMDNRCGVERVSTAAGTTIDAGTPLFDCIDRTLATRQAVLQAQIRGARARAAGLAVDQPVKYELIEAELTTLRAQLAETERQLQAQHVVAGTSGRFTPADTLGLDGRHFEQGDIAAYVVPPDRRTLRVAIEQADIDLFLDEVRDVQLVFAETSAAGKAYSTAISRRAPGATFNVPSPALTVAGGGSLPTDDDGRSVRDAIFDIELEWPAAAPAASVGSHVTVRFEHAPAPLLPRLAARLRRALSSRLAA